MRTQSEVLSQLHAFAAAEDRLRAVLLNGSRVNPAHQPDLLSDYDLFFAVTDVDSFATDESWLAHFGDVLIVQRPTNPPPHRAWLVIFTDGVRIDFTFSPIARIALDARADSQTAVLLDKDGCVPALGAPSERSHLVNLPDSGTFAATCNEFWWVLLYAAKGLWRGQLTYARGTFDGIVRPELERMLVWHAVAQQGMPLNPGSFNKYLPALLPAQLWADYERTFAASGVEENWNALEAASALMAEIAPQVASAAGCTYDYVEGENALRLLRAWRTLPVGLKELTR